MFLNTGQATLVLAALLALVVLPFLPGLSELLWPRDAGRLELDDAYGRDPHYFAGRFRTRFAGFFEGRKSVDLATAGKPAEPVRLASSLHMRDGASDPRTTLATMTIETGVAVHIGECYARDAIALGARSHATALMTEGTLRLAPGCVIDRWAMSAADMWAEAECHLGRSATSRSTLRLARGVTFVRLSGHPIATYDLAPATSPRDALHEFGETGNIIVNGDYDVAAGSIFHGSIRAQRVHVSAGARVLGNVLAAGGVVLASGATVRGHVASAGVVSLGPGSRIGTALENKTVHGSIVVASGGVRVYGSIVTDRGGTVV